MKVAVAGAGKVGRFLAEDLAGGGHEVLLIEKDPELVKRLALAGDVKCVAADACEASSLHSLHLDEAEVMVAVTGDDEDNLVISLLAKQEFAVPRVIARVNHPRN
ncbi:MAG: potassium channel family protein, partial [Acidimicrobiales bacterium]